MYQANICLRTIVAATILLAMSSPAMAQDTAPPEFGDTGDMVGALGWLEFACQDLDKTQAFYGSVFGWNFQPFSEDYVIYTTPAGLMGGFRLEPEPGSPLVLPFILVPDIDASVELLTAAGSEILVPKKEVGEGGSIAVFTDPSGNAVGLADMMLPIDYSPNPFGDMASMVPNTIASLEVYCADFAQTAEFYSGQFGWMASAAEGEYMGFDPGVGVSGVFQNHTPEAGCVAYIWVEDVDAALEAVKAAGGEVLGEPGGAEGTPIFGYFLDPSGVMMGLLGPVKN